MPRLSQLMTFMLAVALLAGCTAPAPRKEDLAMEAKLLKFAGPPIPSFTYLGHYDGFRTLGNKEVVIFTTVSDGYLIRVRDPCINLQFANVVGLTSTDHTVTSQFDFVISDHERCHIDSIRHIDYGAFKRDRDAPH
ncbi:MAG TPA: DUF6491 family protein [Steroidobacteraceae bacterium]|nr:DUF6491 family protein [Steroidobacteraceae bacterium]